MDMYGIDNECISDFGCRKILGMNKSANAYINGLGLRRKIGLNHDTYMAQRKKIHDNQKQITYSSIIKRIAPLTIMLGMAGGSVLSIIKKRKAKIPNVGKSGLFAKVKEFFKKK